MPDKTIGEKVKGIRDTWIEKNKLDHVVKCPFCKEETDRIVITPMNSASAYITADCCGADMEVRWNEATKKIFGELKNFKGKDDDE